MALPKERILSTTRLRQSVEKEEEALGIISKDINYRYTRFINVHKYHCIAIHMRC